MSGRSNGSKGTTPLGGQCPPVNSVRPGMLSAPGNSEASKKAQKKARKKNTSEAMNRIMP